jgi:hypothetical protein
VAPWWQITVPTAIEMIKMRAITIDTIISLDQPLGSFIKLSNLPQGNSRSATIASALYDRADIAISSSRCGTQNSADHQPRLEGELFRAFGCKRFV